MEYQPVPHKLHQDIHKLDKQQTMQNAIIAYLSIFILVFRYAEIADN